MSVFRAWGLAFWGFGVGEVGTNSCRQEGKAKRGDGVRRLVLTASCHNAANCYGKQVLRPGTCFSNISSKCAEL